MKRIISVTVKPLIRRAGRRLALSLGQLVWLTLAANILPGSAYGQQPEHAVNGPVAGPAHQSGLECIGKLQPRRSEQIDGSRWGVSCHWIADKHELPVEKQLEQLAWLGAKWVLLCPDWDRIETEKGKYDWNSSAHCFDDAVAGMAARRIAPVIQVYGGNRLYMLFEPDPNGRPLADAAKLLDDPGVRDAWRRFLEALVDRYHDRVKVWEIWNEPNYSGFWMRETTVQEYGRLVAEAAAVIRRVDPEAVILAGSTAMVPLDFAQGFLASDGADSFDHWSVHPYGELPEQQNKSIASVQKLLSEHGKSPVFWQSECGFPSSAYTGGWGYGGPWDETKHAKWVLRRLLSDAMLGAQASIYFVLNDYPCLLEGGPDKGKMGVNRKGLYAAESWTPKPAAHAYRNLAGLIDDRFEASPAPVTVQVVDGGSFGQTAADSVSIFTLREKATGSPMVVYWLAVPMQTELSLGKITLGIEAQRLEDAILVDLLDGRVYQVPPPRDAGGTATFENLPLSDSPLVLCARAVVEPLVVAGQRRLLRHGWQMQSSVLVPEDGSQISTASYTPRQWHNTSAPSTVLSVLVKNGIYPDPRTGLNSCQIPDSSDEFNGAHDLARFTHLPDGRNPWRDPYWFRKEFTLPRLPADRRIWLHLDCINYRAEAWLNGNRVADGDTMVGCFERFVFDVTTYAGEGANVLAVKILPVDHPGTPEAQLEPFGPCRNYQKEIMQDATVVMSIGYDCMPTVPDRNMGILQDVWVDWTGPVSICHPFVVTELPLPETSRATLRVSTELVNATDTPVQGVLRGRIAGTDVVSEQTVDLKPGETKSVAIAPTPVMHNPRLWWPNGYGDQPLYDLELTFETGGTVSDERTVRFGVRQIASEMHERDGYFGRRFLINGRRILCRGGYLQPEILFDWDAARFETEIRYFTEANLNLVYFEDIPNPPDEFMDLCDRYGLLLGNCYYGCYWLVPWMPQPPDAELIARGTVDIIKRYRNHPSLLLHMAMNEGETREDVYARWRRDVVDHDGTRPFIPSGSFPDYRVNPELNAKHVSGTALANIRKTSTPGWIKPDTPVGMNDYAPKSYGWVEPAEYFNWVREAGNWMFMMESGSPSVPPMSSLARFLPDLMAPSDRFAPDAVWAHHDACGYFKPYDEALRRLHGDAESAADYAWKAHLLTADQHRAMFEAVQHRLWDITSGFTQWKINACWPSVEWQLVDWYLKPMVSYFYTKRACEPLHVQLNQPDRTVSVINKEAAPREGLKMRARVLDANAQVLWEKATELDAPADGYRELFVVPEPPGASPVYFVKLELNDVQGQPVSDNFYWLLAQGAEDYKSLQSLPMTGLDAACEVETGAVETIARVKIGNPSSQLAFFVQLSLVDGPRGQEILPVLWDDNYFSLLPGESREIAGRFVSRDAAGRDPRLEVGGWNVQTKYDCADLKASKTEFKAQEPVTVTARISHTFLDGSRVALLADGRPVGAKWAWARGDSTDEIVFETAFSEPGAHTLSVGAQSVRVKVNP